MKELLPITALIFLQLAFANPAPKRSLAALTFDQKRMEEHAVAVPLNEFLVDELKGGRAGFPNTKHWTDYVVNFTEQPGWDMIMVVKTFKVEDVIFSEDLMKARAKVTFYQDGELSSNGKYIPKNQKTTVVYPMIYHNQKWMIYQLPDGLMPQVVRKAAIDHFVELTATAKKNKNTGDIKFYAKSLAALKKLK